jgi:DNA-directed RNA polymerase subunit M/transcription elongation factor TFIIS
MRGKIRLDRIKCSFCGEIAMYYSQKDSFDAYSAPDSFVLEVIDKIVNGILNEYLVYVCENCGSVEKFTYRDIERMERKRISQMVIDQLARMEIVKHAARKNKVFVYCGKCGGFDGKGSCLIQTYRNCELKRLPNEL